MNQSTTQYLRHSRTVLWTETEGHCVYCGLHIEEARKGNFRTVDHLLPRSKGGSNKVGNLVPACSKCNGARGHHWPPSALAAPEWREYVRNKELKLTLPHDYALKASCLSLRAQLSPALREKRRKERFDKWWNPTGDPDVPVY